MNYMKIAAIGDELFIRMFELIGAVGFIAKDEKEMTQLLKKIVEEKHYGIIVLPEKYVDAAREIRNRIIREGAYFPLFVFLPDHTGIRGKRMAELKKLISLAVGVELKL